MPDERTWVGIIGGTGIQAIPGVTVEERLVETPYGPAAVAIAEHERYPLVFLNRHGTHYQTPPHQINFRANLKALQQLGVTRVLAVNAVGSINRAMPPRSLVLLNDYLDFTSGRPATFYDGGQTGMAFTMMDHPYCPALRRSLLEAAPDLGLDLIPNGIYVCCNGPRFETPAEIRMYARLGGDVVGMTGLPEASLARELGIHYAAVAYSINWASGLEPNVKIVREGISELVTRLLELFISALRAPFAANCSCERDVLLIHSPKT
jgi:5'-methylthioadenosine phosphorylase